MSDTELFRQAFRRWATTVVIVTYRDDTESTGGHDRTSMSSLSADPPSSSSASTGDRAHPVITRRGSFGVDMLSLGQRPIADHCSVAGQDKLLRAGWLARCGARTGRPASPTRLPTWTCVMDPRTRRSAHDHGSRHRGGLDHPRRPRPCSSRGVYTQMEVGRRARRTLPLGDRRGIAPKDSQTHSSDGEVCEASTPTDQPDRTGAYVTVSRTPGTYDPGAGNDLAIGESLPGGRVRESVVTTAGRCWARSLASTVVNGGATNEHTRPRRGRKPTGLTSSAGSPNGAPHWHSGRDPWVSDVSPSPKSGGTGWRDLIATATTSAGRGPAAAVHASMANDATATITMTPAVGPRARFSIGKARLCGAVPRPADLDDSAAACRARRSPAGGSSSCRSRSRPARMAIIGLLPRAPV